VRERFDLTLVAAYTAIDELHVPPTQHGTARLHFRVCIEANRAIVGQPHVQDVEIRRSRLIACNTNIRMGRPRCAWGEL
jgi:hypothetical protein